MARPVEIDRDDALRKALDLFWRKGYRATSLNDLLHATGMGKGSFYAAFGSKQALFECVLERYHAASASATGHHTRKGLTALRNFLDVTMIKLAPAQRRRGCLLVNSVLELEGVEPQLHKIANRYLQDLESRCLRYLCDAQASGELKQALDPDDLAALTATLLQGLRVDSRMGRSQNQLRQRVDLFISLIAQPT